MKILSCDSGLRKKVADFDSYPWLGSAWFEQQIPTWFYGTLLGKGFLDGRWLLLVDLRGKKGGTGTVLDGGNQRNIIAP